MCGWALFSKENEARENYRIIRTASVFLTDAHPRTYVKSSHPGFPFVEI